MNFIDFLNSGEVIIFDGGMGTELEKRNVKAGKDSNREAAEAVKDIHSEYIKAGANVITANTFTFNRIYDKSHGGNGEVAQDIMLAVSLAKQAAGEDAYVLGDMCSTGEMLAPFGLLTEKDCEENYYEAATCMLNANVDGIIIETFFDLNEMLCAIRGCRMASKDIPIIASMTYSTVENGGRTIMGNAAQDIAMQMVEAGANAIGVNCGDLTPLECAKICKIYSSAVNVPILVQPNAGLPQMVDGKTVFSMSPQQFASDTVKCKDNGARLFGGCCGTTPDHIRELAKLLK